MYVHIYFIPSVRHFSIKNANMFLLSLTTAVSPHYFLEFYFFFNQIDKALSLSLSVLVSILKYRSQRKHVLFSQFSPLARALIRHVHQHRRRRILLKPSLPLHEYLTKNLSHLNDHPTATSVPRKFQFRQQKVLLVTNPLHRLLASPPSRPHLLPLRITLHEQPRRRTNFRRLAISIRNAFR